MADVNPYASAAQRSASSPAPKRTAAPAPRTANFAGRVNAAPARILTRSNAATALQEEVGIETAEILDYVPSRNVVTPISRRLTLTELTERTCKWPVGDPLKDDFHFCGCEALESSPYCKFHAKLAYQPVSERRKA